MDFNFYNEYFLEPCKIKEESGASNILPVRHSNTVFSRQCVKPDWDQLRQHQLFCDGIIISDEADHVPVHRALMAAYSSYFRAAYSPPLGGDVIHVKCSTQVLNLILDFIYTGNCQLKECTAKEVLLVADMYLLETLAEHCCQVLKFHLKPSNSIGIHKLAQHLCYRQLESASLRFTLDNFEDVVKHSEELYSLDVESLEEYLSSDILNVRSEYVIEEVIKGWIEREHDSRLAHKERLSRHVRIKANVVKIDEDIQWARAPQQIILTVGGFEDERTVSGLLETFDPRSEIWLYWGHDTHDYRAYHGMVVVDEYVYVVGGFDGTHFLSSVRKFEPVGRYWTAVSQMNVARCFVSVVALNGFIYALGGRDSDSRLDCCESYDVYRNQWHFIPSMHCQRSDSAAAVLNGKIYVAGGYDGYENLHSIEVFDPSNATWEFFVDLPSPRSGLQLVTYQDRLYALGGYDGNVRLDCVDSISARSSMWVQERKMLTSRSNFAAISFEDRIWVIGGYGEDIGTLRNTESFGPEGWRHERSLCTERSCLAAVVLTNIPDPTQYSSKYWHEYYADSCLSEMVYEMEDQISYENY